MVPHRNTTLGRGPRAAIGVLRSFLAGAGALTISACGSGSGSTTGPTAPSTTVPAPVPMNLYPVDVAANNPARLFIFVTAVGSQAVSLPLAFDTGSAGITLNALAIFPSSIVSSGGFHFGAGESSISYNGITVTQLQGTRSYGGATGRSEIGNLGFATITFGDSSGSLTTRTMPVFLYYAIESNANPPEPLAAETQDGWFGVDDAPNLIKLSGSTSNAPECTQSTTTSCWVASVFKYLDYASGVDAGFLVSPSQVQACDITSPGNCMPASVLTVGLDSNSSEGFNLSPLPCPPAGYTGPSMINGYSVCQEYIPNTTIAVSGSMDETFATPVLFDSGTPDFVLNVPNGDAAPSSVASFQVTTASGFVYSATTGTDLYGIRIQQSSATTSGSIMGLAYFETNSLLINFTTGMQGWK